MSAAEAAMEPRVLGNEAYKKGNFEEAITLYTKAMAAGDAAARLNRAAASMAINRFGDAIVDLSAEPHQSVKSLSRISKSLTSLGALVASEKVLDVARELLATTTDPNAGGLIREAEDMLRPAASILGDDAESVALSYGKRAGINEAEEAATRLLQASNALPFSVLIGTALGFALLDAGRLELAAAVAKALIGLQVAADDGKLGPIPTSITLKAADVAEGTVVDLSALSSIPPAITLLVLAHLGQGDIPKAQHEITEALSRDPDASSSEGKEAIRLKKVLNAITKAKEAANELYTAKSYAEALAAYISLADLCKSECGNGFVPAFVHSNIAAARLALGTPEEAKLALEDINRALRVWPFNPNKNAWQRKATCLLEANAKGKHEAMASAIEAAQKLSSDLAAAGPGGELAGKLFSARTKAGEDDVMSHPENDAEASFALDWAAAGGGGAGAGSDKAAGGKKGKGGGGVGYSSSTSTLAIPSLAEAASSKAPKRLMIVDAFAEWCGPCKQLAPVFEKLAVSTSIPQFIKIDGDKCRATMGKLGVRAFPTLISFLDGKELDRLEGADPRRLQEMVEAGIQAWKRAPKKGMQGASEAASSRSPIVKAVYSLVTSSSEMNPEVVQAVGKAMGL